MVAIAKQLDARFKKWRPPTARKVKRLVAELITLADQETRARKSLCELPTWDRDPFFADHKLFRGKTPRDFAANHDRHLYGTGE